MSVMWGCGGGKAREISLGDDFGDVAVKVNGVRVEVHTDGSVDAYTEGVVKVHSAANDDKSTADSAVKEWNGSEWQKPTPPPLRLLREGELPKPGPADDSAAKAATHEIGAIESAGEHKGEIYGGIYPADNKPIWFSAAPKLMDHYAAAAWAQGQGGSLPTRAQGDYLTTLKGKGGAFTEIFNRGGSFPAGYVWLAEPKAFIRFLAWCQRLSDGHQDYYDRQDDELPVLCVRR